MLGTKIKQLRELKNYTREYMADRLSMSEPGYSRIERNEVDVNFTRLQQIAEVLEIDVIKLIDFDGKKIFNSTVEKDNQGSNGNISGDVIGENASGFRIENNFPEELKKLYDDKIRLLEEQIIYLKQDNERLKG